MFFGILFYILQLKLHMPFWRQCAMFRTKSFVCQYDQLQLQNYRKQDRFINWYELSLKFFSGRKKMDVLLSSLKGVDLRMCAGEKTERNSIIKRYHKRFIEQVNLIMITLKKKWSFKIFFLLKQIKIKTTIYKLDHW